MRSLESVLRYERPTLMAVPRGKLTLENTVSELRKQETGTPSKLAPGLSQVVGTKDLALKHLLLLHLPSYDFGGTKTGILFLKVRLFLAPLFGNSLADGTHQILSAPNVPISSCLLNWKLFPLTVLKYFSSTMMSAGLHTLSEW